MSKHIVSASCSVFVHVETVPIVRLSIFECRRRSMVKSPEGQFCWPRTMCKDPCTTLSWKAGDNAINIGLSATHNGLSQPSFPRLPHAVSLELLSTSPATSQYLLLRNAMHSWSDWPDVSPIACRPSILRSVVAGKYESSVIRSHTVV